ncbi:hypothetical protein [Tropicimonas sp.]|uniref:hypothetical protein n=1 Tax=Tropicimonas sp. TaxID=2067044 RepID=UPI003A887A00
MQSRARELSRLQQIAEAVWLGKSQDLRRKAAEEREVACKLASLADGKRISIANLSAAGSDGAQLAATARWMRWAERERQRLNRELARLRAEKLDVQQRARASFGRNSAVEKLIELDRRKTAQRRNRA